MPEPTTTSAAAVTLATSAAALPVLTLFGMPLGLRPDELLAGFAGAIAAMSLLDSVPSTGDTIRELFRTSMRRVSVAVGSAVTAGYLVPLLAIASPVKIPVELELSLAFVCGAGAQRFLRLAVDRAAKKVEADQ